jgi:beta-apo-4'-carotenal oxygenase
MASDYTPLTEIPQIHKRLTNSFQYSRTRPLPFRVRQLRKFYHALSEHSSEIVSAMEKDLSKPAYEASWEMFWVQSEILNTLSKIESWACDEKPDVKWMYKLMSPRIKKDPFGTVLIIGPFNYPFQLVLLPLVGAIAAGCTAVVKPSEMTPNCAEIIKKVVQELDQECYTAVIGGIEESTALLDLKWDKIMYTGNGRVARIIAEKAVKHLTPLILELGGLNPTFITSKVGDAKLAAKRIAWGKVHNCGQICLSPDYVLIDPSVEAAFVEGYVSSLKQFHPNGSRELGQMSRIVNERHFNRIKGLLDNTKGEIVCGGQSDEAEKWIEPTLIKVDSLEDSLFSEEIFGPLMPYYVVKGGIGEMTTIARKIGDTPLAAYAFTDDEQEQNYVLNSLRSGGVSFNDVLFHGVIPSLPFGGVGESGTGCYRGKHSFDAFTHRRPIITQPNWIESRLAVKFPPFPSAPLFLIFITDYIKNLGTLSTTLSRKCYQSNQSRWSTQNTGF